jgi:hypothetical protein
MPLRIETRRNLSHRFEEKGISSEFHPSKITIQIHDIDIPQLKASRVTFGMRNDKKFIPAMPYAHLVAFDLKYHSLVFDVLKVNIHRQQVIMHPVVGQAVIKLSELERYEGELLFTFPVFDFGSKSKEIGTIMLRLNFEYGEFVRGRSLDIPFTNSPGTMSEYSASVTSLPNSENSAPPLRSESTLNDMYDSYSALRKELDSEKTSDTESLHSQDSAYPESSLVGSQKSRLSSISSEKSYSKRTMTEGLNSLNQLYSALTITGWKMSKVDFGRAIAMLQSYNDSYPTYKTFDAVQDDEKLRIAAYFIHFAISSYPAAVINYFGYGKVTDLLKVNQNLKAALSHLKLERKHMLIWEYESHGLFDNKPCFFVCYDKNTKAIVISIRGTFVISILK